MADVRVTETRGWRTPPAGALTETRQRPDTQQLVSSLMSLFAPQRQAPAQPFQALPMLDTVPQSAQMSGGGGGDMAAIQQALQMLAKLLQGQQGGGGFPGMDGPGY
jgi:hypothetical protein